MTITFAPGWSSTTPICSTGALKSYALASLLHFRIRYEKHSPDPGNLFDDSAVVHVD